MDRAWEPDLWISISVDLAPQTNTEDVFFHTNKINSSRLYLPNKTYYDSTPHHYTRYVLVRFHSGLINLVPISAYVCFLVVCAWGALKNTATHRRLYTLKILILF